MDKNQQEKARERIKEIDGILSRYKGNVAVLSPMIFTRLNNERANLKANLKEENVQRKND